LVYNRALAVRTQAWYDEKKRVGYSDTSALLTEWKKQDDLQFLSEVSCVPLQQGLRHLQKAFSNFFEGRAKYPTFKKKRNGGSAEFTKSAFKFRNGQVFLANCSLAVADSLSVENCPKAQHQQLSGVKLTRAGRWTVSLLVDVEIEPLPPCSNEIGVDLGVTSLVALSDGEKIANPKGFNAKRRKLKKAQKALSRKQKGSNNRHKARLFVAKVHQEIADARKDFLARADDSIGT
jgi:putative transposase